MDDLWTFGSRRFFKPGGQAVETLPILPGTIAHLSNLDSSSIWALCARLWLASWRVSSAAGVFFLWDFCWFLEIPGVNHFWVGCVSPQIHMATLVGTIFVINRTQGFIEVVVVVVVAFFRQSQKLNVPWLWYVFPYRMIVWCSSMGIWPHSIL